MTTEALVRLAEVLGKDPEDHVGMYEAAAQLRRERDEAKLGETPDGSDFRRQLAAVLGGFGPDESAAMLWKVRALVRQWASRSDDAEPPPSEETAVTLSGCPPPGAGWRCLGLLTDEQQEIGWGDAVELEGTLEGLGVLEERLGSVLGHDLSGAAPRALRWRWSRPHVPLDQALEEEGLERINVSVPIQLWNHGGGFHEIVGGAAVSTLPAGSTVVPAMVVPGIGIVALRRPQDDLLSRVAQARSRSR